MHWAPYLYPFPPVEVWAKFGSLVNPMFGTVETTRKEFHSPHCAAGCLAAAAGVRGRGSEGYGECSMSARSAVPRNTERMLWAEAIGHCMNPECQAELIGKGISIGEMAHINAHADGGDVSFENLILLCSTCHTRTDANTANPTTVPLRDWKSNRNSEIEKRFAKHHSSFEDLKESVTPILRRNGQIFDSYGPNDELQGGERHELWV